LDCPSCREYVDGKTHRCFIQRALTLRNRKRRGNVEGVVEVLAPNEGPPRGFKPTRWRRRKTWTTMTWTTVRPYTCF